MLKMSSENQTVDHRNKIIGNDHGTILCDFTQYPAQEDTNFVATIVGQSCNMSCPDLQEHVTCLVRTYRNIDVIRSQEH
jgi:hypothetical protein